MVDSVKNKYVRLGKIAPTTNKKTVLQKNEEKKENADKRRMLLLTVKCGQRVVIKHLSVLFYGRSQHIHFFPYF